MLLYLRVPACIHRNISRQRFQNIPIMIGSPFTTQSAEIVYDSEPERIQIRVDRRQRKLQKLNAVPMNGPGPSTERTRSVGHNDDRACSVIELTDSDTSLSLIPTAVPIASSSIKQQANPPQDIADNYDEAVPVKTLDMNRFAFVDPVCKKGGATTNKPAPASRATSAASIQPRRAPSKQAKHDVDILPSDLDKISRCISCDAEWTTRKTGVQKLNHIRSCAKKHYLDKETVDVLVQQVVAKYTPLPDKGKAKETSTKATFYEEVLGDAAPRKRTKRQVVQTLLANVSTNRDDILARAQNVLQAAPSVTPTAQSLRETTPDHYDFPFQQKPPPATQQFGTSLLAQARSRTTTKSLFEAIYSSPPAAHISAFSSPETQKTPSKGGELFAQFEEGVGADRHQDISSPNDTPSNVNLRDAFKSLALERPDQRDVLLEVEVSNNEDIVTAPAKTPETRKKRTAKPKTPKPPKVPQLVFEEEWESYMKETIMKDDKLYMRVLRYEPIHFNEFIPLAESFTQSGRLAASTAKLRLALRKYLDDQAIHFYDESWKPRNK